MSDRASIIAAAQARLNARLAASSEPSPEAMQALLPPAPAAPDLASVLAGAPLPPARPMNVPPVTAGLADVLAAPGFVPVQGEAVEAPPDPTMSRPVSAARSFGNAAAGVLGDTIKAPALAVSGLERSAAAAVPERVALLEREVMDLTVGIENAQRSGAPASMVADMVARRDRANAMLADMATAAPTLPAPRDPQQIPGWDAGNAFKAAAEGVIGAPDPAYRDDFWTSKVPAGAGSSAGFLVAGLPAALMGPAGWLGTALTGASVSAVSAFEEAIQSGADVGTALQAAGIMGPVGLSEALPIARAFDAVPGGKGAALAVARKILTNSAEEALQEGGQTLAQNATAAGLGYDPNRPLTQGLGENMLVGAIVGGGTSAAVEGVRALAGDKPQPNPAPSPLTQPPAPPAGLTADVGATFAQPYEGLAAVLGGAPTAPQQPAADAAPRVSTVPGIMPQPAAAPAQPVAPEPDLATVLAGAPPSPADVNRSAPAAPAAPAPVATPPAVGAASLPPQAQPAAPGLGPDEEYMESDRDELGRPIDPVPGIWNNATQTWRPLDAPAPEKGPSVAQASDPAPVSEQASSVPPAAPVPDAAPQVDAASDLAAVLAAATPPAAPVNGAVNDPVPDLASVLAGAPPVTQNSAPESPITPSGVTPPDYDAAVAFVRETGKASTSLIQRKLGMRYADATAVMDRMQAEGVVSAPDKVGRRTVTPQRTPEQQAIIDAAAARAAAKQEPQDVEPAAAPAPEAQAVPAGRDGDGAGAVEASDYAGWRSDVAAQRKAVDERLSRPMPTISYRKVTSGNDKGMVEARIMDGPHEGLSMRGRDQTDALREVATALLAREPAPEVSVTQKPDRAARLAEIEADNARRKYENENARNVEGNSFTTGRPKSWQGVPTAEWGVREVDGRWQARAEHNLPTSGHGGPFGGGYATRDEAMGAALDDLERRLRSAADRRDIADAEKKAAERALEWVAGQRPAGAPDPVRISQPSPAVEENRTAADNPAPATDTAAPSADMDPQSRDAALYWKGLTPEAQTAALSAAGVAKTRPRPWQFVAKEDRAKVLAAARAPIPETPETLPRRAEAADDAWMAEIKKAFPGERAGDVRYFDKGKGEPGTPLRAAYEKARALADELSQRRRDESDRMVPFGQAMPKAADKTDETDNTPRPGNPVPLYVERKVDPRDAQKIIAWAKSQGFPSTLLPDDLHVTIAYSKAPVDVGKATPALSGRLTQGQRVAPLGDKGAVVLFVDPRGLTDDWKRYRDAGASWDHGDGYQPHISITYKAEGVDLDKVEPFTDDIRLGPERQKALELNRTSSGAIKETPTGANTTEAGITLPAEPGRYFLLGDDTETVPIAKLRPLRARPEGIANAGKFMREAYDGQKTRRKPISVRREGDGTFTILDGNSTFANMQQAGWRDVPVRVLTDAQFARESTPKFIEKIAKETGAVIRLDVSDDGAITAIGFDRAREAVEARAKKEGLRVAFIALPEPKKGKPVVVADLSPIEALTLDRVMRAGQPDADITAAINTGILHQRALQDTLPRIAGETGATVSVPSKVKERDSIERKVQSKGYADVRSVTDIARGGFVVDTAEMGDAVARMLGEQFAIMDEGWNVTPLGYFDRKIIIRFDDGALAEIQIWPKELLRAKQEPTIHEKAGHDYYEVSRDVKQPDDARADAVEKQKAIYAEALRLSPPDIRALASAKMAVAEPLKPATKSSRDSSRASMPPVSRPAASGPASPTVNPSWQTSTTPSSSSAAGSRPQSKNLTGPSSDNVGDTANVSPAAPARNATSTEYGAKNVLVSKDRAAVLAARLKAKMDGTQLNAGVDPEIIAIGAELAVYHIEAGARRFADMVRAIAADLDMDIMRLRPYARSWYNGARDMMEDAGLDVADMDGPDAVRSQMAAVFAAEASDADGRGLDQGGSGEAAADAPERRDEGPGAGAALDDAPARDGEAPAGEGAADPAGERAAAPEDRGGDRVREGGDAAERGAGDGGSRDPDAGTGDGADAGDRPAARPSRPNYVLDKPERIVGGTAKQRFAKNRAAIEALQAIEQEGREPTPAELDAMAAYTGWGAFGQELFQGSWERPYAKQGWAEESQWLRDTLGEKAWKAAADSIINAHYTDPPTVKAMWGIVEKLGFKGGRILEPSMGVGNFFSMMPQDIAQASDLTGIELDQTTGAMAKHLFPQANVRIMGYEQSRTPDGFYDLVIGNWPFADLSPADRRYDRLGLSLHNYFFVKALDQTRPGGLVAGVTSRFTMDAVGRQARMEMAKRGDLVAAFRLPTGAFEEYAGTAVVTDIIVLKKRETPNPDPATEAWVNTGTVKLGWQNEEFPISQYYLNNPSNVLGKIELGQRTTFGRPGLTVAREENFARRLSALPSRVPEGVYVPPQRGKEPRFTANQTREREGAVVLQADDLHVVQGDRLANLNDVKQWRIKDAAETAKRLSQFKALIEIRRQYEGLIAAERAAAPDIEAQRQKLKNLHAAFVTSHGPMIDSFALRFMETVDDPHFATLAALEGQDGKPAAIMGRSTMRPAPSLTNPTVRDAYVLARNENTVLDMARVAELAGVSEDQVRAELIESGAAYAVPGGGVEAADVYLSGNVVRKLAEARDAQERGEDMARSIAALEKARPARVPYFQIEPQLGATWISVPIHQQFIAEMLGAESTAGIDIAMVGGGWRVRLSTALMARPEAKAGFGSPDIRFDRLITAAMGNRPTTVMGTDEHGKPVKDDAASKRASEAAQRIREHFTEWAYKEPERRLDLEREYNDTFRAVADPQFDGSFLTFPGMALTFYGGDFDLRQHQRNAVWRGIVNGYGLYAHEVGTGKTATAAALAVESKRYGKAKKPILFAHNANSRAVFAEAQGMYPGAKMLYVDNLSPKTIKTTLRRIANDDWDLIVVPHSVIDRIGFKRETLMALAQDEIAALEQEAIDAAQEDGHSIEAVDLDDPDAVKKIRSSTAKELAKQRLRILAKIEKDAARAAREDAVTFEDLGVDMVLVDEAHVFKKPPIATKMQMRGLNRSASDRSIALKFLTDYVKQQRGGTGVHLFTGTPITNTLGEIYHMSRYVISNDMEAANVADWDAWFNTFAAASADVEPAAGGGFEIVTRLRKFVNVAELRRMMGTALDVVFADDMPEFRPRTTASGKTMGDETLTDMERDELLNGRTESGFARPYKVTVNDIAPITPLQKQWLERIVAWGQAWKGFTGKERREAMLAGDPESPVIHKGIEPKVGLDVRMVEQGAPDEPDSKVNRAVRRLLNHYLESPDGTQVVFAEVGDSRESKVAGNTVILDRSPIEDLIEKLVAGGVRREEIAVVGGGVSPEQKQAIAAKVNRGEVRIVIGKTETLGTGVNMQKRLRAMHHLDAPWMPGQLEQRNGRGWRQGNQWNTVYEYRYITEGVDGGRWNVLAVKDRFIQDFKRADDSVREIEGDAVDDADSADADSIMATLAEAIGDPRILQKEKLAKDVERLQRKERLHTEGVVDTKSRARQSREEASRIEREIKEGWAADAALADAAREAEGFEAKIGGKVYKKRTEAADALQREYQRLLPEIRRSLSRDAAIKVGEVHGFEIVARWLFTMPQFSVRGAMLHDMGAESLASAEATIRGIPKKAADRATEAAELRKSAARLDKMAEAPFAMAETLAKRQKMLDEIDADLRDNPVAPPMWLRRGAPVDSRIFVRREPRIVRGHRWATNGWFVITDEGPVPYLDARDQYGVPLYQEVPFQEPADGSAVEVSADYLLAGQDKTPAEMALDDDGNLIVREQRGMVPDLERRTDAFSDITASDRFRLATSPEQMAQLRKMLDHYGLRSVRLMADPAGAQDGRQAAFAMTADGRSMAILMAASFDPAASLNHEVIHALRAANLFTAREWGTLTAAAREGWLRKHRIKQRYPDLSDEQQIEEAVAEAFAEGMQGTESQIQRDPWRIMLARVKRLFQVVKRWLGLQNLDSPAAIFGAVAEGVIGRGPRTPSAGVHTQVRAEQRAVHANAFFAPNPSMGQAYRQTTGTYAAIRAGSSPRAVETTFDELRRQLQDRMLPLLRAQQLIERSGVQLTEAADVYLTEETFTGRVGARLRRIERRHIEPVMGIIAKSDGLTIDSVARYLTARHAPERNAHIASINAAMPDGGAGFDGEAGVRWTTAHAQAVRAQMEAGPDGAALKRIARMMHRMRLESINARVEYGLLSEDQGKAWKAKFREYVPLRGFAEDDSIDATGVGQGFNTAGRESRMALGRESEAFNPLVAAFSMAQEVIARGEKNRVGQALHALAKAAPAGNGLMEVKTVTTKRYFNQSTGLVETRPVHPITMPQADRELAVKIRGVEHRILIHDRAIMEAMKGLGAERMNAVLRMMRGLTQWMSMANTMFSPSFTAVNAARDFLTAHIQAPAIAGAQASEIMADVRANYWTAMRAAARALKGDYSGAWGQTFKEFEAAGGKIEFWKVEQPQEALDTIERRMRIAGHKASFSDHVADWQRKPVLAWVERMNTAVDNAMRLAAFKAARDRGWSEKRAASLAKNLTVNFNRRGQQGAALNAIVMFYNAGAQGLHMMARAMHSRRVWQRFLIPLIMLGIAEDIINAALSDEDDDGELAYDKVPAWQRSMFLLIGGGDGIAVPLPYGYNMFVFAGKQLSRTIRRGVTGKTAFGELMQAALTSVSPPIVPTVYEPYRAWTQNTDWRGRPIRPEYAFSDFGPKSHKAYGSTSDLAKGIAQSLNWITGGNEQYAGAIDIAPGYIDHFVGWLGGGIGRLGQDLWRSGESLARGEAPELSSIPIVDRLGYSTGIWLDRERFYQRRDEVKAAAAVLKDGGREALSARDAALLRTEERMKSVERALRQVKGQRETAYEMPQGAARTDRLQRIEEAEQRALDAFNKAYNDAVRGR